MTRALRSGGPVSWPLALVRPPDVVSDAAIAAICWVACTLPVVAGLHADPHRHAWLVGLTGASAAAPLALRRRFPISVAAVVTAVIVLAEITGVRFTPWVSSAGPVFGVAVYTLAAHLPRRASLPLSALLAGVTWAAGAVGVALHTGQAHDAVHLAIAVPAWLIGDAVHLRHRYTADLARERQRQAAAHDAQVRAEERLRLSRDVHDVVSHSLSSIVVRSAVARLLAAEHPEQAADALAAIETASRSALNEVRELLRQTRDRTPMTQAPGLADLDTLVTELRACGMSIDFETAGQPGEYSIALGTAAFRIAQEALTNAVKHAGPARVRLTVEHGPDHLAITVADNGRGPVHGQAAGLGLRGMRERAELLGGSLHTGAAAEGGFLVLARLPAAETGP